jgi:hypothetical protein
LELDNPELMEPLPHNSGGTLPSLGSRLSRRRLNLNQL